MTKSSRCHKCNCQFSRADEIVRLWDQRLYCVSCVERRCKGLSSYARSNPVIEEITPDDFWETLPTAARLLSTRRWLTHYAILLSLVGVVVYVTTRAFSWISIVIIAVIVADEYRWLRKWRLQYSAISGRADGRRSIRIDAGIAMMLEGDRVECQVSLDDVRWMGLRQLYAAFGWQFAVDCGVLAVIAYPTSERKAFPVIRFVGFDEEMRAKWEAFFTLANVANPDYAWPL